MSFWKKWRTPAAPSKSEEPEPIRTPAAVLSGIAARIAQGDLAGARAQLDGALAGDGANADLRLLSAQVHRLAGQPMQGLADCELALAEAAEPTWVQLEMAQCWLALPDIQAAIDCLNVAVALDENNGAAWLQLGECLRKVEDEKAAQEAYRHAAHTLKSAADQAQAWFLLGQSLMYTIDVEEAHAAFTASLALNPELIEPHIGLGNAALWLDREPEAVTHFEEAMKRTHRPERRLLLNLGSALQNCGRFEEARRLFARVAAEQPRDHVSRWYLCQLDLTLCHWAEGWSNYPARFGSGATSYRPMPYKPWDGRPAPDDTLLILADEGIGDEIMYASCFEEAARHTGRVIVECETRLQKIFARSFPHITVIGTRRENDPSWLAGLPQPDWQIPSGDLPGIFRRSDDEFPDHRGYLKADPARVAHWRSRLEQESGPGLKVGISWRGGLPRTRTRARTIDAAQWGPILGVPGVQFVNLQYGDYGAELTELERQHGVRIHDYPEAIADYDETAALVCALDLVITVCTAIVHLGGALGRPVWILTPLSPGWRYTARRQRMPWYPSSRIFRQRDWGNWEPVCQEVSVHLREWTHGDSTEPAGV